MCLAVAIIKDEVPTELTGWPELSRRLYRRGEAAEYRFDSRDPRPRLPILRDGRFALARWGNVRGQSRHLPRTGWTWHESVKEGYWRGTGAVRVQIPASYGLDGRGVWYMIRVGIQGLLVPDERGRAVAYMVCEPASHYYHIMTGADRMPRLIGDRI